MNGTMDDPNSPEIIRMACSLCRRRKLKCSRQTPSCDSCIKLQQECVYGVVRLKKVTRKDRTKTLEGRLAQIEKLLRIQDGKKPAVGGLGLSPASQSANANDESAAEVDEETIRELENIYFEKIHPSIPMLHRDRYMQSTLFEPARQPPIFLRHAIWALAASISVEHANLEAPLCYSSRKYLEDAELRDARLDAIGVQEVQTWTLIAALESKNIHIHRLWMSTGRAVRMAQLMGLFRIDKTDSDKSDSDRHFEHLAEPKDWVEREEWRRTFWMAFCLDRYGGMGTGWPMGIDDRDIETFLPCDEESFQSCRETKPMSLMEGMTPQASSSLSPFSALIVITALSCRKMQDLKRMKSSDLGQSRDAIGDFIQRSSWLDSTLSTIYIPRHLRMPSATKDPLVIFLNMICHSSTITVINMSILKADGVADEMVLEGKRKCLEAAAAITNCMRGQSIMDLSVIHPFTSFCLYKAATVFAECMSESPTGRPPAELAADKQHYLHSLSFLIMSMNSLQAVNPLVVSFLADIYRDYPDINEWLKTTGTNENLVPQQTSPMGEAMGEADPLAWDSRMGFYQSLSKENEIVGEAQGGGEFGMDFGGMGIGDGVGGFDFLAGSGGDGAWPELPGMGLDKTTDAFGNGL